MPRRRGDILETLPARPLRPDERELLAEWLAAAGDVASAYVSDRRTDDPALYHRIVVTVEGNGVPTYLIHTSAGARLWIVMRIGSVPEIGRFPSLQSALNSIRPVLALRQ